MPASATPSSLWRVRSVPALAGLLVALVLLLIALRAAGLFGPALWRPLLPLGFVLMALSPWLLMNAAGRRAIGLRLSSARWALGSLALGLLIGWGLVLLNQLAFGAGPDNAFATIGRNYQGLMSTSGWSIWLLHAVFTTPALLFSPIGEELFFRGLLQQALAERWGLRWALALECLLFGLVHLLHHGLSYSAEGGWSLRAGSGAVWVLQMTLLAAVFASLRGRSGSLLPAVLAHAGFNLGMNHAIFTRLWPLPGV